MRNIVKVAFAVAALAGIGSAAQAAVNLVSNGGFSTTTATSNAKITTTNVAGWSTTGYNFIFLADANGRTTADTTATNVGGVKLWGPNSGSANGLTTSLGGTGGNFIAADDNYGQGAITQTINNLTIGNAYRLSFDWAASQQAGFDGITQSQWTVGFGNQTAKTDTINLPSHGFSGWGTQTFDFTASATSQVLSFLATGTPGGNPPFTLLDNVSVAAVPEPATWGLMLIGFGAVGVALRRRNGASVRFA